MTGLEALVNTRRKNVTKQFQQRLWQAGMELSVPITEAEAKEAYDYRSNFVHGQFLQGEDISKKVQDSYIYLETMLRLMVKQSVAEAQYTSRFESEATIDAAYPI